MASNMVALAKRQPKPERMPADLAADIQRIQQEISEFVDGRIAALRAGTDGASLPSESLRMMLVRGECPCRCALRLINE
jgi:hypothetical protein